MAELDEGRLMVLVECFWAWPRNKPFPLFFLKWMTSLLFKNHAVTSSEKKEMYSELQLPSLGMIFFYPILKRYYNVKESGLFKTFWGRTRTTTVWKSLPRISVTGKNWVLIQHGGKDCDLEWLWTSFGAKATMNLPSVLALAFQDLFSLVWLYLGTGKMAARFISEL